MARKGQEGVPEGYKRCSKCGEVKEVGEFGKDNRRGDSKQSFCKPCEAERMRLWRKNNIEKKKNDNEKYQTKNKEKLSFVAKEKYKKDEGVYAKNILSKYGIKKSEEPVIFNSLCLQIKLKRAIKAQKNEGHKEVTNG